MMSGTVTTLYTRKLPRNHKLSSFNMALLKMPFYASVKVSLDTEWRSPMWMEHDSYQRHVFSDVSCLSWGARHFRHLVHFLVKIEESLRVPGNSGRIVLSPKKSPWSWLHKIPHSWSAKHIILIFLPFKRYTLWRRMLIDRNDHAWTPRSFYLSIKMLTNMR